MKGEDDVISLNELEDARRLKEKQRSSFATLVVKDPYCKKGGSKYLNMVKFEWAE